MAEFPALPLWTDAYLADTLDLTFEDHGLYLLMLLLAWRRPDNALPNDMAWLKRALAAYCAGGIHGHTFNARVPKLLQRFWSLSADGKWHQKRLDRERAYLVERSEKNRQTALKRWSNQSQTEFKSKSNGPETHIGVDTNQYVSECEGNTPTPTPTPIKKKTPSGVSKEAAPDGASVISEEQFREWYAAYPRKVGPQRAAAAYRGALRRASHEEIMDGLRRAILAWQRNGTAREYIPHPATWLTGGRWADEQFDAPANGHIKADPFFAAAHDFLKQDTDDATDDFGPVLEGTRDDEPHEASGGGALVDPLGGGGQTVSGGLRGRTPALLGGSGNGWLSAVGPAEGDLASLSRAGRLH